MYPAELVSLLDGGPSIVVGTVDPHRIPHCMRATGARLDGAHQRATVYLPKATSHTSMHNLGSTRRIAVTVSEPASHRTFQLKGRVNEIRDPTHDEETFIDEYIAQLTVQLGRVGLPSTLVSRLHHRPCWAIDFDVSDIFTQTPGPGAGTRLEAPR